MSDLSTIQHWDSLARLALGHLSTFFLFILCLISFSLSYTGEVRPYFFLMAVFYWAIYRPTYISPFAVFTLGLAMDSLLGFPLGLNALVYVFIQWLVRGQRLYLMGQPYIVVWLGFALVCLLAAGIQWLIFAVISLHLPSIVPVLSSVILSIFLFPVVSLILIVVHKFLPFSSSELK